MKCMATSMKAVTWSLLLLVMVCYSVSILMVGLVGIDTSDPENAPAVAKKWERVGETMWRLMVVSVGDGWAPTVEELADEDYVLAVLVMLLMFVFNFLGLMN